jgi:tetratricopeptide (TPR) repeat protein/Cdc6-like AAA superfamily ATPase
MPSERVQRRIDALLDEADAAISDADWPRARERAEAALAFDPDNTDAREYHDAAARMLDGAPTPPPTAVATEQPASSVEQAVAIVEELEAAAGDDPTDFAGGRYKVLRFLGEGGKKRVFLAHDALLDRDIAFSLIKTEGLDDVGRERIMREAQAMGRLSHQNIVAIYDIGEHTASDGTRQPYLVQELMGGGDVEDLLNDAEGALPLQQSLDIALATARGLEFAHEAGVIHRDLKPGNVWLTADGVAKIGDLGLAVTLGQSRLTSHGMMVGTFGYMPPEQALGQEVTAQADLYSLGAMLYELVTGQPPFRGDTPTAVISQHLNTQPVAPSWHTEHCPPDLEALILHLLAKVPADRPASATEVIAALESIDPDGRSASHSDSGTNPLDRLASGVFVGRERELERLREGLDGALGGHGSLVMLVGEPGIGKTRTTQELETYARMRGAKVLWGRAHERAGAPPYWPWVQLVRDYRDQTTDEVRRRQYQPYATELQRIFPALRELFPNLPEPPADTEEGQFRLFDAFSSFLRAASTETPLVIVLDDLHWADSATLSMLTYLTRELGRSRVLVLGTYRDTDLDRRHPLSQALADLNREDLFTRIPLRGLSLPETTAYIRRTADVTPAPVLVQRIHDETEGNPFFLSEVVNLMAEDGTLSSSDAEVQIPEGVRQALGRRLDRLSEEANALLTTLAVVGREFDHALVLALSPDDDDVTTLRLVEEALRARVLEETGAAGRYRFRHALMQQTLLEELSAARQVLLHGQIADALLTTYGADNRDTLTELAEHYAESAVLNPAHARSAASTLRRAAESAADALAWDDAARLYERCLALVTGASDRLDEDEGLLWLQLALARFADANLTTGWEAFDQAATLLETRLEELAPAVVRAAMLLPGFGNLTKRIPLYRRIADSVAGTPSLHAYQALGALAYVDLGSIGDEAARQARSMGELPGIGDPRVPYLLAMRIPRRAQEEGDFATALASYEKLRPVATAAGALPSLLRLLSTVTAVKGDFDRVAPLSVEYEETLRAAGSSRTADARQAIRMRDLWQRRGPTILAEQLDRAAPGPILDLLRTELALESGEISSARATLPPADHPIFGNTGYQAQFLGLRCRVLVADGDMTAAQAAFVAWSDHYDTAVMMPRLFGLGRIDDALCVLADHAQLEQIAAAFEQWTQLRSLGLGAAVSADYLRGAIALTLDRVDVAERWFNTGLEWSQQWGLDTITGRSLYGLAEVAERRGDHALAMQQLDTAGALFAGRGAKLYLDRVIAKKEILKA